MENKIYYLADNYSLFQGEFKSEKYYLFDIVEGSIFKLNEVSHDMLSHFDGENKVSDVLSSLLKEYDVEKEKLEEDLSSMVEEWVANDVLIEKE